MSPRRTSLALLVVLVAALVSGAWPSRPGRLGAAGAGRPRPGRAGGRPAPLHRLAPGGRRGFWWVKWVVSIEVDRDPWWRQPPFPLT